MPDSKSISRCLLYTSTQFNAGIPQRRIEVDKEKLWSGTPCASAFSLSTSIRRWGMPALNWVVTVSYTHLLGELYDLIIEDTYDRDRR